MLIVDDDPPVRQLITVMVAQGGYETLEAQNGFEALHVAETNQIDLLVTDFEMPGMSGPELISALKQRGLIGRSLLVTGNAEALDSFNGSDLAIPFLAKPFTCTQLLGRIQAILND